MFEIKDIKGAKLIFSPLNNIESASLGIFFRIGARFEPQAIKGVAHFLEHMVFKGSKRYSHLQIKREIEGRGGSFNAFTSQESTGYYAHVLDKNLYASLSIILDMVFRPLLKPTDISKERKVICEEIKMYNDLPSFRAGALLDSLLWPAHPLGEEVAGSLNTVAAIQRSDLYRFRHSYYTPGFMVVSLAGGGKHKKLIKAIERYIAEHSNHVPDSTPPPRLRGVKIATEKKNLQQCHLCLGFRSFPHASPYRIPLQLLNIILGANMSSRLFEELREKKSLCYDISTQLRRYKDSGAFIIHAGLDKSRVLEALKAAMGVLLRIRDELVPEKELSRAKDYFLGQIVMALENPQGRMFYFAEQYLALNKIIPIDIIKKQVYEVSPGLIQKVARSIFNFKAMCVSCVGNIDDSLEAELRNFLNCFRQ